MKTSNIILTTTKQQKLILKEITKLKTWICVVTAFLIVNMRKDLSEIPYKKLKTK